MRVAGPLTMMMLLIAMSASAILRSRSIDERYKRLVEEQRLVDAGDLCISWKDLKIDKHWKPQTDYGVQYCDPRDYPPGVVDGQVGMLMDLRPLGFKP